LENYTKLSKKIEDVVRKKSNLCKVDNSQEIPLDDKMATINVKGLKEKQGFKEKRRIRSCTEVAIKKNKSINNCLPQSNQYFQVINSQLYTHTHTHTHTHTYTYMLFM